MVCIPGADSRACNPEAAYPVIATMAEQLAIVEGQGDWPALAQPLCEAVGCQAERDDVFLRNAPGHAPTLP